MGQINVSCEFKPTRCFTLQWKTLETSLWGCHSLLCRVDGLMQEMCESKFCGVSQNNNVSFNITQDHWNTLSKSIGFYWNTSLDIFTNKKSFQWDADSPFAYFIMKNIWGPCTVRSQLNKFECQSWGYSWRYGKDRWIMGNGHMDRHGQTWLKIIPSHNFVGGR